MLVSCAAYQDGRKLQDLEIERISDYLQRPNCFVWVALRDPPAAELGALQRVFGLHPLAIEDAQSAHQRPKIEEYGIRCSRFCRWSNPAARIPGGRAGNIVGRNYVLSVRNLAQKGFQDCAREASESRICFARVRDTFSTRS